MYFIWVRIFTGLKSWWGFNVTDKVIFVTGLIKFVELFQKEAAKPYRGQAHLKSSDM